MATRQSRQIIGTGQKTLSIVRDGNSTVVLSLSNDTHIVPSLIDKDNNEQCNYKGCETYVSLQFGNRVINPSLLKYNIREEAVKGTWNNIEGRYVVTELLEENGYVDFETEYLEEKHTARFTVSKVSNGSDNYLLDLGNTYHAVSSNSEGYISLDVNIPIDIYLYKGIERIAPERIIIPKNQPGMTLTASQPGVNSSVQLKILKGKDLALAGWFDISVVIHGKTFKKEFRWLKVRDGEKGEDGEQGPVGPMGPVGPILDWVQDWDGKQTFINGQKVIAPRIFAGSVSSNQPTGVAIGQDIFGTKGPNASLNGISGLAVYNRGVKTVHIKTDGTVAIGKDGTDQITIGTNGVLEVPAKLIAGTVESAQVITGSITAEQISGGTITGTTVKTNSALLDNSGIHFNDGSTSVGTLSYNYSTSVPPGEATRRLWLRSHGSYALKIESAGNMSIAAADNCKVYINRAAIDKAEIGSLNVSTIVAVFG